MGLYMYINENDRTSMRKVTNSGLNELFQEALQHDSSLMISGITHEVKQGWFKKPKEITTFNVYHECLFSSGVPLYEARLQMSASGELPTVTAYLYGIINGSGLIKRRN